MGDTPLPVCLPRILRPSSYLDVPQADTQLLLYARVYLLEFGPPSDSHFACQRSAMQFSPSVSAVEIFSQTLNVTN